MEKIIFLLLPFLFLLSCHKDDNSSTTNQFQKTDFPINIGNKWRYLVYDTYAQTTDTLTLKVVSKSTLGTQTRYNCELYQQGILVDTSYYSLSDNKIEYNSLNPNYSYFGSFILNLPFQEGDKWNGFYLRDTIIANGKTYSFKVLGKEYSSVYTLKRTVTIPNYFLNQLIYVTPKIGVIYQSIDLHDGGVGQKQGFQLIDYELK